MGQAAKLGWATVFSGWLGGGEWVGVPDPGLGGTPTLRDRLK